ncbi:MAG: hypothetical protein ACI9DJ_002406 [Algoriphagus sp.]|jgi:hypothetical protein
MLKEFIPQLLYFNRVKSERGIDIKSILMPYIFETIEVETATSKVAFDALTKGRQRGYNLFFCNKLSQTRIGKIKKNIERILNGYGINDSTNSYSEKCLLMKGPINIIIKQNQPVLKVLGWFFLSTLELY